MLTGPDVSEHQGNVDWGKVAKDHELAIARVADGDHRDPWYSEERVRAIRKAGLLLAPYYFARVASPQNNERDGDAEAAMVLGFAKSRGWRWPGDLPLVYDFETSNAQPNQKCARHVVQFVRAYKKSEDHYPGIYTMPGFWAQILPHLSKSERELIARCPLHQAEWGVSKPQDLEPWDGAALWQWTDSGSCAGVSGKVDMNRSLVTEKAILALAKRDKRPDPEGDDVAREPEKPDPEPGRPGEVPKWVPSQYWELWQKPWDDAASKSSKFRELCWEHGFASPHFDAQGDRLSRPPEHPGAGEPARERPAPGLQPGEASPRARRQAACDPELVSDPGLERPGRRSEPEPAHAGRRRGLHRADRFRFRYRPLRSVCDKLFANGGVGNYPSGSRHVDSRGTRARWTSF